MLLFYLGLTKCFVLFLTSVKNGFCSDTSNGKLRRLVFIRDDGSSMSVPVPKRSILDSAATGIKAILDANAAKVTCIKLVGEYWRNLNLELGVNYTAGQVATSHKSNGGATKQHYYTGRMQYQSDAVVDSGDLVLLPVKSFTDVEGSLASQISIAVCAWCKNGDRDRCLVSSVTNQTSNLGL
jgi:hypothetical protein